MFMSVVEELRSCEQVFPELAGARVLITGLTPTAGVDVARAFAEHKARLVVQTPMDGPEITEVGALLAEAASDIKLFTTPVESNEQAVRLAQLSAQSYGGLDVVINIVAVTAREIKGCASLTEVEALVSEKLLPATLITRVAANRMRLTMTEGSILNVLICPAPRSGTEAALIGVIRSTLACLTREEAREWASSAIRINAVGPRGADGDPSSHGVLTSEPDIAQLGLVLASKKGRQLSGYMFDAEGSAYGS